MLESDNDFDIVDHNDNDSPYDHNNVISLM